MILCLRSGIYHSACEYCAYYQEGCGWSPRSFIWCTLLQTKIFFNPPIPRMFEENDAVAQIPTTCPKLKEISPQLSLF